MRNKSDGRVFAPKNAPNGAAVADHTAAEPGPRVHHPRVMSTTEQRLRDANSKSWRSDAQHWSGIFGRLVAKLKRGK